MKLLQSLSFRLFLLIFTILVLVFSFHTYMSIQLQTKQSMHHIILCARRISDLVKSSTHYSMLINRKQDIQNIVTTVGHEPDIENLSIINHDGEYIYTSNPLNEHKIVDMQSRVCIQCHSGPTPSISIPKKLNIINSLEGYRIAELTRPILNEPSCYNAACHAHPKEQQVLGLMNIQISLRDIDNATRHSIHILIFLSLISVTIIIFVLWLYIRREVIIPVQILHKGTREIGHGNLEYTISFPSKTEIGDLAHSFNQMTRRLREAQDEITQWSRTLESRVEEKSRELENAQQQMMHVEKMASLGKLSATVAHEINNPLAGILNYTKLIAKRIKKSDLSEEKQANILEELGIIESEIKRLGNIVKNLLTFARGSGEELIEYDINKIVEKSLLLVNHHFQMHNIRLETRYCTKACIVKCNPDHLKQALIAIYVNAVEAMSPNSDEEGGTLRVEVWKLEEQHRVQIRISDTGIGISKEDLPHIFEPFYSTKNKTSGVGLGLSVVYGIVKNHGGTIRVQSKIGEGTTFFIEFPSI
ncbi:MAG: HAMP domain-containing protein [Calditrichaeota bacterium]|nr:HAMP domain-containing protein [Calditrichota bacterium]